MFSNSPLAVYGFVEDSIDDVIIEGQKALNLSDRRSSQMPDEVQIRKRLENDVVDSIESTVAAERQP